MGCDGGTIPRRDELVRLKKKPEQKDKDADREFRWLHCALTQQRLQEPIVMCTLGRLYSKQQVIEQLLEKDKTLENAKHIKGMKDIKTLSLTPNPAYVDKNKSDTFLDTHAPYICKLMGLEMSGKFRFIALWSCGCAMSERGFKQIKSNSCPICQTPYSIEDVIVLNGTEEDIELMKVKIEMRNTKRKAVKKENSKKAKAILKVEEKVESLTATSSISKTTSTNTSESNITKTLKASHSIKRIGAATSMEDPDLKRLKTDYSVAKDPKASEIYKSLFTTHKSEQEQTRAHWVTYNPFYN